MTCNKGAWMDPNQKTVCTPQPLGYSNAPTILFFICFLQVPQFYGSNILNPWRTLFIFCQILQDYMFKPEN